MPDPAAHAPQQMLSGQPKKAASQTGLQIDSQAGLQLGPQLDSQVGSRADSQENLPQEGVRAGSSPKACAPRQEPLAPAALLGRDAPAPQGSGAKAWFATRLPSLARLWRKHMSGYFVPKNLNVWYVFGALALLVLGMQLVTGVALAVHYKPDASQAFASLERIMRHVRGGALIRYAHSTGASAIFVLLYLHIARGLLYGSYRKPRELVWLIGCALFVLVMAEAFVGHLLPWGQMSYWGAQVITTLLESIPGLGPDLAMLARGGHVVGDATLSRFFVLHVIVLPLLLLGLVALHVLALRDVGSSNPDGVDVEQGPRGNRWSPTAPADTVPFHPYYTVRDVWAAGVFLTVFFAIVFFAPEMGGYFLEPANFTPANPQQTPPHIAPIWYFRPFYAILRSMTAGMTTALAVAMLLLAVGLLLHRRAGRKRWPVALGMSVLALLLGLVPGVFEWSNASGDMRQAWEQMARWPQHVPIAGRVWWLLCMGIDATFWGLAAMAASILALCVLPWLDRSPVASIRYRPHWHRWVYWAFAAVFVALGVLGGLLPSTRNMLLGQVATALYFAFFLLMPWWSRKGTFRTVPSRITNGNRPTDATNRQEPTA